MKQRYVHCPEESLYLTLSLQILFFLPNRRAHPTEILHPLPDIPCTMFERIRRIFGCGQTRRSFPLLDPDNKDWMAFRWRREEKYSPMSRIDDFENSSELWSRYERYIQFV